jgi:hypothetical protein
LAQELQNMGHAISYHKIGRLLKENGHSIQSDFKAEVGAEHIDRDAQFINSLVKKTMKSEYPIISVDTKKRELICNFDNKGQQWRKSKNPRRVNGHDFPKPDLPRACPYGIYDITNSMRFINIGTDHDTSEFAANSIKGWWRYHGIKLFSDPGCLLITPDCGGLIDIVIDFGN